MQIENFDTVIIGGGQAGLAMSYWLTQQDRDHVILEKRQRVAESWRGRWDSFTLVTPNWMLRLPGHHYDGSDPNGFLTRDQVVAYLEEYVDRYNPPIRFGITVTAVERNPDGSGYLVQTTDGSYEAANVVVAVGTFQRPNIPSFSEELPGAIKQIHSSDYRNPEALPEGAVLVVGSGQSGCQIAQELNERGRQVFLCVGSGGRLPRRYRGKDGMRWFIELGVADQTVDDLGSPEERFDANPLLSGKDGGQDINLHQFARDGITLLGYLEDFQNGKAVLAPDLHENLAAMDKFAEEFCKGVDKYVEEVGLDVPEGTLNVLRNGFEQEQLREIDLADEGIKNVIWATGFQWDFSWVDLPVFDEYGYPKQRRGITEHPGLYFLGLHWLHTIKSGVFYGVGEDAAHIAEHISERSSAGVSEMAG